jgi:hypothetical protein
MRPQFVIIALTACLAGPALAGPASINARQDRQEARVEQGVHSGRLTAAETARLDRRSASIAAQEARMRADGQGLSARERATLQQRLNAQSRAIATQKHDRQRRH